MKLGSGWLNADPGLVEAVYYDVRVPRVASGTGDDPAGAVWPTRIQEYGFVVGQLEHEMRGATILDAGAGFNPEIHVLDYVLGNMGHHVMAVDANPRGLEMPPHEQVQRFKGDICLLPFPAESYDVWICVSVLEHMMEAEKALALYEAKRVLRPRGLVLLTTDETHPAEVNDLLETAGFEIGSVAKFTGTHLSPRVAYATARKS